MKTNPGGQIPSSEVIGRDKLIQRLWRILERQSLVLTAERRMGKTCIVKKMVAEAPQDKLPIYHDLEGVQNDHYVIQETDGAFRFRFPLIQRSWQLQRGLVS